jgi:hypothetical protein
MFSESVFQVARSWVDMSSFHTFIGSRVHGPWQFSRWTWESNSECASNFVAILGKVLPRHNDTTSLQEPNLEPYAGSRPVAHQLMTINTQGDPTSCTTPETVA